MASKRNDLTIYLLLGGRNDNNIRHLQYIIYDCRDDHDGGKGHRQEEHGRDVECVPNQSAQCIFLESGLIRDQSGNSYAHKYNISTPTTGPSSSFLKI